MEYNGIIFYKRIVKGYEFYYPNEKYEKFDAKKYYQENKEMIKAKGSVEFICECGSKINMRCKSGHLKSKKHIAFLESKVV